MIVEFRVSNYLSIGEEQCLSFVAGDDDTLDHHRRPAIEGEPQQLLTSLVLFGANGAGKSNIIIALRKMIRLIRDSSRFNLGDSLDMDSFAFSSDLSKQPSTFDLTAIIECGGLPVRFQYGFQADDTRVHEEWLYRYANGEPELMFHREVSDSQAWSGPWVEGEWFGVANRTNANCLYLSKAGGQENHPIMKQLFIWATEKVLFFNEDRVRSFTLGKIQNDPAFKEWITSQLKHADTGIKAIEVIDVPAELINQAPQSLRDQMRMSKLIKSIHTDPQGKTYELEFRRESKGTIALFDICGPVHEALERGAILILDELTDALHPLLAEKLMREFHEQAGRKGSQLVFTTHCAHLIRDDAFRKDQIWLVEKDEAGFSHYYSLWDFEIRSDMPLERAYLSGRFGAIPLLGEVHG